MVELSMAKEILITSEDILTNGIISQDVVIDTATNITNINGIIATVTATIMIIPLHQITLSDRRVASRPFQIEQV